MNGSDDEISASSSSFLPPSRTANFLSVEQVDLFNENGYLVIPRFLSEETVGSLKSKISSIISTFDLSSTSSIFTTKEQTRSSDDYFLSSGDKIRFFWEENAIKDGEFVQARELCINKVGHNLHDLDSDFEAVSYDPRLGNIARDLGMLKPVVAQSMYIFKQPNIGGEVGAHQDGAFLYTEPQSVLGYWWALDDCTLSNGCLWAVPGSHRLEVQRRFRRSDEPSTSTEFVPKEPIVWDLSTAVPLEIPIGSLVLIHFALVHFSEENKSPAARHAYSIHVVDGADGIVYPEDNWLQRPPDNPFRELP